MTTQSDLQAFLISLICVTLPLSNCSNSSDTFPQFHFLSVDGCSSSPHNDMKISSSTARSVIDCAQQCSETSECSAFSTKSVISGIACELLNISTKNFDCSMFTSASGWKHMIRQKDTDEDDKPHSSPALSLSLTTLFLTNENGEISEGSFNALYTVAMTGAEMFISVNNSENIFTTVSRHYLIEKDVDEIHFIFPEICDNKGSMLDPNDVVCSTEVLSTTGAITARRLAVTSDYEETSLYPAPTQMAIYYMANNTERVHVIRSDHTGASLTDVQQACGEISNGKGLTVLVNTTSYVYVYTASQTSPFCSTSVIGISAAGNDLEGDGESILANTNGKVYVCAQDTPTNQTESREALDVEWYTDSHWEMAYKIDNQGIESSEYNSQYLANVVSSGPKMKFSYMLSSHGVHVFHHAYYIECTWPSGTNRCIAFGSELRDYDTDKPFEFNSDFPATPQVVKAEGHVITFYQINPYEKTPDSATVEWYKDTRPYKLVYTKHNGTDSVDNDKLTSVAMAGYPLRLAVEDEATFKLADIVSSNLKGTALILSSSPLPEPDTVSGNCMASEIPTLNLVLVTEPFSLTHFTMSAARTKLCMNETEIPYTKVFVFALGIV